MGFPRRRAKRANTAADGRNDWPGRLRLVERSCCCPAMPVVMVLIPPISVRPHHVDLLLCRHHYRASRAALAAVGAVAIDETGAILEPASTSIEACSTEPR